MDKLTLCSVTIESYNYVELILPAVACLTEGKCNVARVLDKTDHTSMLQYINMDCDGMSHN
eukprot:3710635-Amphidinium_carterae.1